MSGGVFRSMSFFFRLPVIRPLPRVLFGLFLPLALAVGCASGGAAEASSAGASGSADTASPDGPGGPAADSGAGTAAGEASFPTEEDLDALLSQWAIQLDGASAGESTEESAGAHRALTRLRAERPSAEQRIWAMAMIHLLPESPFLDRERGQEQLALLEENFPEAIEGVQATVLRQLFRELDRTAADAEEGERLVQELTRTVAQVREAMEQLKRIDLNRRPIRGVRGDTIPGGS